MRKPRAGRWLSMPPHCDSLDGPVVTAAREALARADVDLILPYVHGEVRPRCVTCLTSRSRPGHLGLRRKR